MQIFSKDKITLDILQDVLGGMIKLQFQVGHGPLLDYASGIHEEGKRVYVCGKFNISEDAIGGNSITIRPIMIDAPLTVLFSSGVSFSGKKVSVIRSSTKTIEQEYEISSETSSIELIPQNKQCYLMRVTYSGGISANPIQTKSKPEKETTRNHSIPEESEDRSDDLSFKPFEDDNGSSIGNPQADNRFQGFEIETSSFEKDDRFAAFDADSTAVVSSTSQQSDLNVDEELELRSYDDDKLTSHKEESEAPKFDDNVDVQRIEKEITVIEKQQSQLSRKKQSAIDHLDKIEAEYKKDYESFERELEDYKSRMDADASIIEQYKDQDVMPIEIILKEVSLKLEEAEEQIRFFIEAKQRKTMEIENEIKSNKKQ